jgi:iron complex transport system ATP-binding protein
MTGLAASGLTVRRGGRAILDAVSASFAAGEFVAVIGPNGSGKSTLLAALAGLIRSDSGEVQLDGRTLQQTPRKLLARRRAYLPQKPRAEWPLPVERLVALGLTPQLPAFGPLPAALALRVDEAVEAWALAAQRGQPVTTLSGGELARVMLARALVGDPDILIADEPIAGLDPRHSLDTVVRLRGLAAQGKLVVAALHDLTLAVRYATRIVALHEGRIVADGPVAEVLTAALLRRIFEVEAIVSGAGEETRIDIAAPSQISCT